jgi:hypothetical protein
MNDLLAWGVEWHSRNRVDGETRSLIWDLRDDGKYHLFRTRRECREFIEERYGYIKTRPDLRIEPHGWRLPRAVRVRVAALDGEPT